MDTLSLRQNKHGKINQSRERIGALATLPVFYRLNGKKVIVAGGSDAAAWKAELLAATGANVHIYAEKLSAIFVQLICKPSVCGSYIWHRQSWAPVAFADATIAIADAETDAEAQAFFDAARSAGVAVNVIDKPDYCEFQFGSIVNRSPVVISISTDGAAPILGQALRRRIEAVVGPSMNEWAKLAKNIRSKINENLQMGSQRRAFWESFVDRAFGAAPTVTTIDELIAQSKQIAQSPHTLNGKITYIDAGAGEAELLTLKAIRALQAADIIFFDSNISNEVLELARREAKRVIIGKLGGRGQHTDEELTMLDLANKGHNVVRLECGGLTNSSNFRQVFNLTPARTTASMNAY